MRPAVLIILILTAICPAGAQIVPLKSFNTVRNNQRAVGFAATIQGKLIFLPGNENRPENELWVSDGTAAGTQRIISGLKHAQNFTVANETLYFFTYDLQTDYHTLWKSDGTEKGTRPIKPVSKSNTYFRPVDAVAMNGKLYFFVNSESDEKQLWQSDGTEEGTRMIAGNFDISDRRNVIFELISVNQQLFFVINQGYPVASQLWRSDGTPEGTAVIKKSGPDDFTGVWLTKYYPDTNYAEMKGVLYFAASDPAHGMELWRTDGTAAGTWMLRDLLPGQNPDQSQALSANPSNITRAGDYVYFTAQNREYQKTLWRTDGTPEGTIPVKNICENNTSCYPLAFTEYQQKLFFVTDDAQWGREPWLSTGTAGETAMIKDIHPGYASGISYETIFRNTLKINGYLYFPANDGAHGMELWRTDGTPTGTNLVADLYPGAPWSAPQLLAYSGQVLYLAARDHTGGVQLFAMPVPDTIRAPVRSPVLPATEWYQTIGATESGNQRVYTINEGIAIDKKDNIYVTGRYGGAGPLAFFDNQHVMAPVKQLFDSGYRKYFAKFRPDGLLHWAKPLGGVFSENSTSGVLTDSRNNSYVTGSFFRRAAIDTLLFAEAGGVMYVAKYSENGDLLWLKTGRSSSFIDVQATCMDAEENIYVSGVYQGLHSEWDGKTVVSLKSHTYFLVKYSKEGTVQWARNIANAWSRAGKITGMQTDRSGKIYVLLTQGDRFILSSCKEREWSLQVSCLAGDGSEAWVKNFTGDDLNVGSSLAVSPLNEVCIAGNFRGEISFDDYRLQAEEITGGCTRVTGFLVRLSSQGKVLSADEQPPQADPYHIRFGRDGTYYLTGMQKFPEAGGSSAYGWPFPAPDQRLFVRQYDYWGNLIRARELNKGGREWYDFNPLIATDSRDMVVLYDISVGMLDTIPNGVINANSNVFLTKFSLKAVEPLPAPAEELLLLAPNPTSSTVYIQSLDSDFSAYQLEIYNSIGQLLSRQTKRAGIDLYPVDVSLVPDGVYVFVFSNGRKTITRRVLKQ